jgi:uncharacterized protein YkwD
MPVVRAGTPWISKLVAACAVSLCALALVPAMASAGIESNVVSRLNQIRSAHGLSHLGYSPVLANAAAVHSADMSRHNFFSHTSGNGRPWFARVRSFVHGRHKIGETIAWVSGGNVAARVVSAWMQSPEHRATLLDASFCRIGVALSSRRDLTFVTADLSTRR